jgi:hypothetical protein
MPLDPTPPAPAIEIHIGRIEVQAQRPPAVATAPARPVAGPAPAGGRGLVDYLGWKVRGRGR